MEAIKAEIWIFTTLNSYIQEQIDITEENSDRESVNDDVKKSDVDETKKTTIECEMW